MGAFVLRSISKEFLRKYRSILSNKQVYGYPTLHTPISAVTQIRTVYESILHKDVVKRSKKQQLQDAIQEELIKEEEARRQAELSGVKTGSKYEDLPIPDMTNPYARPITKCIICEHNIELDYKNTRLLSQFLSPHTGLIYGRKHTGLCQYMQRRVSKLIIRARYFGLLPYMNKDPRFLEDTKLVDPFAPKRRT